ncbi:MAG: GTP cyclohydrolase II, partial [Firmicutes bacterium]|nr:GTP cyclohydrolase II [Bacillota bacterium]
GSLRCDCGEQLDLAMRRIAQEGRGILLYMRQEGRGIGLANKIRAYALQEAGYDTVTANLALGFPPDSRDYGVGAQILYDLGARRLRLLTNNPQKYYALNGYGLSIVERVPLTVEPNEANAFYLETKKAKLGHWM